MYKYRPQETLAVATPPSQNVRGLPRRQHHLGQCNLPSCASNLYLALAHPPPPATCEKIETSASFILRKTALGTVLAPNALLCTIREKK